MTYTRKDLEILCAYFNNVQWTVRFVDNMWQAVGVSRFAPHNRPHLHCSITATLVAEGKYAWEIRTVGIPVVWGTRSYPEDNHKQFVMRFLAKAPTANWKLLNE